ncbi:MULTISPECIES: protein-export chaperone SecB [Thiomicrorhabdus]|uniref:Protein-export protein SecB n=1 Tax=Thiomicrorhabdus heinhorstiae TaxID=2748010 RepID=A0ABS0BZ55_9GAMM|nr:MULTISPECIES: protein-export chaperone SecB [Thiomicrorhabdus]MBF6059074.1 protein-export chaperone SecB [Thiomicrorhabdus heinhorstiae]
MSEQAKQAFVIQKIYTKDVSFESPNTPELFTTEFQPELSVDLNVESKGLEENIFHVAVRVTVTTKIEGSTAFLCEVSQAGIFTLAGFSEAELGYMLGAQCPNVLFPYAREVVSDLVTRGGFPQLLLEPVNFEMMYHEHMQKAQGEVKTQ